MNEYDRLLGEFDLLISELEQEEKSISWKIVGLEEKKEELKEKRDNILRELAKLKKIRSVLDNYNIKRIIKNLIPCVPAFIVVLAFINFLIIKFLPVQSLSLMVLLNAIIILFPLIVEYLPSFSELKILREYDIIKVDGLEEKLNKELKNINGKIKENDVERNKEMERFINIHKKLKEMYERENIVIDKKMEAEDMLQEEYDQKMNLQFEKDKALKLMRSKK